MKVISIEVTTLTQAVGQARNLKSKTIEIGCSNKNDVPNIGKKTKKVTEPWNATNVRFDGQLCVLLFYLSDYT